MTESSVRVTDLRCEYLTNPLGLDVRQPRLSWRLESPVRGARQTAYQVRVSTDQSELWDSGKVLSDASTQQVYQGQPLAARQRAGWQVRVWDEQGQASPWSAAAFWEMGLLEPADWQAAWITPEPALAGGPPPTLKH